MTAGSRVTSEITRLLEESLNITVASPDTDLIETGLLDSLGIVEVFVALEEASERSLPLDSFELDRFRTVHSIAAYLADAGVEVPMQALRTA